MKKSLLNIAFAVMIGGLVILTSCSKDEPLPLATVNFVVSTPAPEVFLPVKFDNESLNASFYVWEYGDGDKDSATAISPLHTFDEPGNYSVKLKAYNDDGAFSEAEKSVKVGERFLTSASIINMSMVDDNGDPWDVDSGPDVIFEIGYADAQSIDDIAYGIIENLNGGGENDFSTPISISVDDLIPEDFVMSYNDFYIAMTEIDTVDNEPVFIDMAGAAFNPLEESDVDTTPVTRVKNDDGTGFIQIPFVVIGEYQFLVTFEVR